MILRGDDIFHYLASEVREKIDASARPHWNHYHSSFKFNGDGFEGLSGFGGCTLPYKGWKKVIHNLLQQPYRTKGESFKAFEELNSIAARFTKEQSRAYDLDVLRQVITLSMLNESVYKPVKNSLVIGDGFGSMTSLILLSKFSKNTILVNLTKTLFVDLWYIRMALGFEEFDEKVVLITSLEDIKDISDKEILITVEAKNQGLIKEFEIDVAINIASMQEMNIDIVKEYVTDMRLTKRSRDKDSLFFYCCNRVEKRMPGGEVSRIDDYGWLEKDEFVFDELCPWHQKYYSKTPPFYHKYDGPIQHRLVKLKLN